ncbi:hypothetical protein B0H11DRAFT_1915893 [Mycena galericulata]|nr:hypothetical protein B0H11DRAFT_1915893 [Mycena galericulata]
MVNTSSSDTGSKDLHTVNPTNLMDGVDFDTMMASEMEHSESPAKPTTHSLFAEIDAAGNLAHKKPIVRTFFDMTRDSHGSHDRLHRVWGFTIGGKSKNSEISSNISAATHFQLGNLFTSLVYNGTHLGLVIAKCTLIKRGQSGSKAASVSAIPRAELHLEASPYMIFGQVFSLVPLARNGSLSAWAWDREFVPFCLGKKKRATTRRVRV